MKEESADIFTTPQYKKEWNQFVEKYGFVFQWQPFEKSNKRSRIARSKRTCRFCGKADGATTFRQDPHVIPYLMRNKTTYSSFECDPCNALFGDFESHLSDYLKVERAANLEFSRQGKAIKHNWKGTSAEPDHTQDKPTLNIGGPAIGTQGVIVEEGSRILRIPMTRDPYNPYKVYKALLKTAMSVLPEPLVQEFRLAMNCLTLDAPGLHTGCVVTKYSFPLRFPLTTSIMLFKKITPADTIPTYQVLIQFSNIMFCFPIPFCVHDIHLHNCQITVPSIPPIFVGEPTQFFITLRIDRATIDLSKKEKVADDKILLSLYPNP